jgi:hypothetical protein
VGLGERPGGEVAGDMSESAMHLGSSVVVVVVCFPLENY